MKLFRYLFTIMMVFTIFSNPTQVFADPSLESRLAELEQAVAILKRQLEIEKEDKAKKAAEIPLVTASTKDGFSIKSPDDSFKLRVRGLLQADARFIADDKKDLGYTDSFLVRRARPIFEGTVAKDFDFYLMPDFGSGQQQLVDGYIEYKYFPKAKFRAGKFKAPFALERLQSDAVGAFTELGLTGNLGPNRDVGVQLSGDIFNETLSYAVGAFNGTSDAGSSDTDTNNDKEVVGRLFAHPFKNGDSFFKGLGVGGAISYGHKEGSSLPTYRSAGQAAIFNYASGVTADGEHLRFSPQAYFYHDSFGVLGEYISSEQAVTRVQSNRTFSEDFTNTAWQVVGTYVLTGENASYRGITPLKPFNLAEGNWGALELVGRYEHLKIDDEAFKNGFASLTTAISTADAWGLGLNWWLNKNVKVALGFEQTKFENGNVSREDRKPENAVLTRFQVSY